MPHIIEITDFSAPELDVFARLTHAQLCSRTQWERGVFIAESAKVIHHALDAGMQPVCLLMSRKQLSSQGESLLSRCGNVPVYTASDETLCALTGYRLTRGALCAMQRPTRHAPETICRDARRIAILESIVDPTNVGALFRSAAALGIDAVLVTPTCCDPLHRRAVRVSMGTVFQIPWTRIGSEPSDWPQKGMSLLHALGFQTAAMALSGKSVSIDDPTLACVERLAIVLGSEGDGLTLDTIAACDWNVRIPMAHGVDSLNVAAASAVAFWQLCSR